jgi:polyferredoxin
MKDFLKTWGKLALQFGGVMAAALGLVTAIEWASSELFAEPWDSVAFFVFAILALSFFLAVMFTRDRRRADR